MNKKQQSTELLDLPWTYTITQEPDHETGKIFIVRVDELPGCVTDAPTIEEAMHSIRAAMLVSFKMYQEAGEEIPLPLNHIP